jgi:hypothetical protein
MVDALEELGEVVGVFKTTAKCPQVYFSRESSNVMFDKDLARRSSTCDPALHQAEGGRCASSQSWQRRRAHLQPRPPPRCITQISLRTIGV